LNHEKPEVHPVSGIGLGNNFVAQKANNDMFLHLKRPVAGLDLPFGSPSPVARSVWAQGAGSKIQ
jgi:hypothetical protein